MIDKVPPPMVLAGIDAMSSLAVIGWWFDVLHTPVGVISTGFAGLWYAYRLFESIEKRFRGKDQDQGQPD